MKIPPLNLIIVISLLIKSINCGLIFREWKYYEWIPRSTSNRYSSVPGGLPAYQDFFGTFKSIAHSIGGKPIHGHKISGHHLTEFSELDDWNQLFNLPMPAPSGFKWIVSSDPVAFDTNYMNHGIDGQMVEPLQTPMVGRPIDESSLNGYSPNPTVPSYGPLRVESPLDTIDGQNGDPVQVTVPMIVNQHNYPAYHQLYKKKK